MRLFLIFSIHLFLDINFRKINPVLFIIFPGILLNLFLNSKKTHICFHNYNQPFSKLFSTNLNHITFQSLSQNLLYFLNQIYRHNFYFYTVQDAYKLINFSPYKTVHYV